MQKARKLLIRDDDSYGAPQQGYGGGGGYPQQGGYQQGYPQQSYPQVMFPSLAKR